VFFLFGKSDVILHSCEIFNVLRRANSHIVGIVTIVCYYCIRFFFGRSLISCRQALLFDLSTTSLFVVLGKNLR
jgi:hypothetical protein